MVSGQYFIVSESNDWLSFMQDYLRSLNVILNNKIMAISPDAFLLIDGKKKGVRTFQEQGITTVGILRNIILENKIHIFDECC